ncbi:MAG: hypothetical protein ETSY1_04155 [Candidatus Entotheonella factor]|uniref:MalT-like TPR region domain-containing protein n=1 Tax=Entotheonella factor TaxID=1429438 RepID=W4LW34_ENTF1|nr:MAG: hypothetical protein ETSY1_04155 [Candidatus Entotheonella factor]
MGQQAALGYLARTAYASDSLDQALILAESSLELGRQITDRFGQSINLELQLQIWQETQQNEALIASIFLLRDLHAQMDNQRKVEEYESYIQQIASQVPLDQLQQIEQHAESIRQQHIAEAKARFDATGRDLFEPPPSPVADPDRSE